MKGRWVGLAALAVTLLVDGVAVIPANAGPVELTLPKDRPLVQGRDAVFTAPAKDPTPTVTAAKQVVWPAAGTAEVALPATASLQSAAGPALTWAQGLPIGARAGAAPGPQQRLSGEALGTVPGKVRVSVLPHGTGGRDLVFRVGRSDGGTGAGAVVVGVDSTGFRDAYGADWSRRLRLVALPECALSTPGVAGCQEQPLDSTNDAATGVVSAAVAAPALLDQRLDATTAAAPQARSGMLVALAAGPDSDGGDFKATDLSAANKWSVGGSAGGFNWSYPVPLPPGAGGPVPQVQLGYSSQSVDGMTAAGNSQPSWVGEGFNWQPGSIERGYRGCTDDGRTGTGDVCWVGENATMTLNGQSSTLVLENGQWRPSADNGAKVEKLADLATGNGDNDGEYWRVTTTDGTEYYFGLNRLPGWDGSSATETKSVGYEPVYGNNTGEPCNANGWCQQAYRWNLDYVVDPFKNTMSFFYERHLNSYARNRTDSAGTEYVRDLYVREIDYGTRKNAAGADTVFAGTAPARVLFGTEERCITPGVTCVPTAANAANFPDAPVDQLCAGTTCAGRYSPTFFTTKRLSTVTTEVATGNRTWRRVTQTRLSHQWNDPGVNLQKVLWLSSIKGCGTTDDADACTPPVQLNPVGMRNRVDMAGTTNSITRYRMRSILTESGNTIAVTYSAEDCVAGQTMPAAPDNNNRRCYPQYWVPPGTSTPKLEYFHKYRVEKVAEGDGGGATDGTEDEETTYEYIGDPAWHSDQNPIAMPNRRTWGLWRGYQKVRVLRGAATGVRLKSETTYFRGMHGDKLSSGTRTASVPDSDGGGWADEDRFAGTVREQINYLGETSTVVDKTKTDPYEYGPTATQDVLGITVRAWVTNVRSTQTTTMLDGGRQPRKTRTTNTFIADRTGRVDRVEDEADLSTTADDQCVRQWYASNAAGTNVQHLSRVEVVAVRCAVTPNRVTDVVSDVRMWYDGATSYSTTLTNGFTSRVEQLLTPHATSPVYQTTTRAAADEHGRSVDVWDAENHHTGTAYTPPTGGPVTKVAVTNPLGWVTETDVDPASGRAVSVVDKDVSGPGTSRRTDLAYDKLGRVVAVWAPGRNKAANDTASVKFAYDLRQTGGSSVATSKLNTAGSAYLTSYSLLDSKLRPRQEQTPAEGGNRVIAETLYDSRGLAKVSRPAFGATGAPSGTLRLAFDTEVPGQARSTYDGAGRLILQAWQLSGVTQWTSSHAYGGDRDDVSPPPGSSATSTFTDARGRITALWTYRGDLADPVNGAHDVMGRTYHPNGEVASVTDGSGNLWTYVVDAMGRVTEANDPDTGKSTYGYDLLGKVTKTVSARNITMYTTYDGLGRKTAEYSGTMTNKTAEWTYDTLVHGQPTAAIRYQGGQAYTRQITEYTAAGQPKKTKVTIPSNTTTGTLAGDYVTESTYNADGTVATATASAKVSSPNYGGLSDETLQFGYTALGNSLTLQSNLGTYVVDTQYKAEGMLGSMQLRDSAAGKNLRQLWSYYPGTKLLSNHLVYGDIPNTVAKNTTYTYDASGNVLSMADRIAQYSAGQDDVQCFRYDDRFRLSEAWTPTSGNCAAAPTVAGLGGAAAYWKSYTSDAGGNRTGEVTHTAAGDVSRTYTYPAQGVSTGRPHAVTQIATTGAGTGTDTYGYDNGGNVTTRSIAGRPSQNLTWTPANQLESVSDSAGTTSYLYDADGARLLTKDPGGTTLHLGDVEYRLAGGATSGTRSYVHAGQTVAVRTPQGLSWQCADHQGTAGLSFKATDLTKTVRRADPFGNPRGPVVTWPSRRGFLNGYADDTGLVHLGAREYDPRAGRFVSVDPILDADKLQGMNGYSYAENSPVTLSDPDGQYACRGNECAPNPPAAAPPAEEEEPIAVFIPDKGADRKKPTGTTVLKYKGKVWVYHNCREGIIGPVTVSPCAPKEELGVAVPCSNGGGGGLKGEICWESTDGFRHDLYGNRYCPLKSFQTACSPGSGGTPKQERVCQNYSTVIGPKPPKYQGGGQYENPFECASGKAVCKVGNVLNFAQFLLGFCPIVWCTAVGAGLGAVSAIAYYAGGEPDKGNRQLFTTAMGLAIGPMAGRLGAKLAFGAGPKVEQSLDYTYGQVGGFLGGAPYCGWTPFGCDDEATYPAFWDPIK